MMGSAELALSSAQDEFTPTRLERVFSDCFADRWNTRLVGGADEPLYLPARSAGEYHTLYYRSDYFASALHETAHWCIAGSQRRQQLDFGYWYAPDGRNLAQQHAFEAVECKPQALEWFFARACAYRFQVSADNLDLDRAGMLDAGAFQRRVLQQALVLQSEELPERALLFFQALCHEFGTAIPASHLCFTLAEPE